VEAEFKPPWGTLQLPTTAADAGRAQAITWPQRGGSGGRAKLRRSSPRAELAQVAVLAAVVAGGYLAYQKLSHMESPDGAAPDSAKAVPLAASSSVSQPAVLAASFTQPAMQSKGDAAPATAPQPAPPAAVAPPKTASATTSR